MSFNSDLENLPSARKLADLNRLADEVNQATFMSEKNRGMTSDDRAHFAYLAGKKHGEYLHLKERARTAVPSRATLRKMAALKTEGEELCARAGLQVDW